MTELIKIWAIHEQLWQQGPWCLMAPSEHVQEIWIQWWLVMRKWLLARVDDFLLAG